MIQRKDRKLNALWSTIALLIVVGVWVTLAPVQVGGPATYIIVNGNSMEPLYHRGDLVILHVADLYQVGDIVTYRHPDIGPVIHRIIEQQDDQFTLRGDNNNQDDTYRPTSNEVIGKAWLQIPSVGKYLTAARSPFNLAILAVVLVIVGLGPSRKQKSDRKLRRRQQKAQGAHVVQQPTDSRGTACVLLGVFALVSLVLTLFAFLRPVSKTVVADITYQQTGQFNYTATAPSGIYDSDVAQTGDPIFPQLTHNVPVKFDYQFTAERPVTVAGTYSLDLDISDGNGWRRTLKLQPEQPFEGPSFTASGIVDLAKIKELTTSFEKQTGSAPRTYTLTVVPAVHLRGDLAGQVLQDEFRPRLDFQLDQAVMQPIISGDASPYKPVQPGIIKSQSTAANALSLLVWKADVASVRRIAPIAFGLALLGLIAVGGPLFYALQHDEALRIRLNYNTLLVAVREHSAFESEYVIDVASIDDLAKLAERIGGPMLYMPSDLSHGYVVRDGGITYRYVSMASTAPSETVPASTDIVWQQTFLDTLQQTGRVAEACSAAGVWLATVNLERSRSPEFAQAWDIAHARSRQAHLSEGVPL